MELSNLERIKSITFEDISQIHKDGAAIQDIDFISWIFERIYIFYKYHIRNYGVHPRYFIDESRYEISIKGGDEKIIITEGMVNFFEDFVEKKLAKVTKSELAVLETHRDELSKEEIREELLKEVSGEEVSDYGKKISKLKNKIKELENIRLKKINELKGFRDLLLTANNQIPLLNGLIKSSMEQFLDDLPGQNIVADREYQRLRRWVKGGKADPNVQDAFKAALKKYKLSFIYHEDDKSFQISVDDKLLDEPEKYFDISTAVTNARKIPRRKFDEKHLETPEDWRPYNTDGSIRLIKEIGIALGGVVKLSDLKEVLNEVLKDSNMGYPGSGYNEKNEKIEKGFDTWNRSADLSGIEIVERITSKVEEKMQDSRHLQDVAYNSFQPYVDSAYDLISLYYEEEILKEFKDFLNKTKKVIKKYITEEESKKVDVLVISMYSNLSSTSKELFKRYLNDFNALVDELGNLNLLWLSLYEELNSSDWVKNE
tara:strand:- start:5669 stop:7126 length:1458 start_codon:yes stop_codon:yes gene_type:complete